MDWLPHVFLLFTLTSLVLAYKTYDGYQVLQTREVPEIMIPALKELQRNNEYDFWSEPVEGDRVKIMTAPENADMLRIELSRLRLSPEVFISDVGETVRREREAIEAASRDNPRPSRVAVYDRYMSPDELMSFLHEVIDLNQTIASLFDLGVSWEGRSMHGIKISSGPGKKAALILCLQHPREWITAPVCTKTIEDIMVSPELQNLADWYILPVSNPDGYAYSWNTERMWRKTRRPNSDPNCPGSDLNKNFGIMWNANQNMDFCSNSYPGDEPFSEPETKVIADFVRTMGQSGQLAVFISLHSYSKEITYPWAYTANAPPEALELRVAGNAAALGIATFRGTEYTVKQSGALSTDAYGSCEDYAFDVGKVRHSFMIHLPRGEELGFDPLVEEILPIASETVLGICSLVRTAIAAF